MHGFRFVCGVAFRRFISVVYPSSINSVKVFKWVVGAVITIEVEIRGCIVRIAYMKYVRGTYVF